MLHLKAYDPPFFRNRRELLAERGDLLAGIRGQALQSAHIVWDIPHDEWQSDAPVVLRFDTTQLELCASEPGRYSVTGDSIDLQETLEPLSAHTPVEWRVCDFPAVLAARDSRVTQVFIVHEPGDLDDGSELIYAVEFAFENGCSLSLHNAGDTNGIDGATFGYEKAVSLVC